MTALLTAATIAALAFACLGLTVSLIHLRRRHRSMRHTLHRVAAERDEARWALATRAQDVAR